MGNLQSCERINLFAIMCFIAPSPLWAIKYAWKTFGRELIGVSEIRTGSALN